MRSSCFGRGPPKNTYVGILIPPAQNTYGGAPSLQYPTTPLTLRRPKPNYGQLTTKGPTCGWCFLNPPFWAHGQVTKNPKKLVRLQFLEPPILGPSGSLALFCSFGILNISGTPGQPLHLPIPTYRPQTHLSWGKPKLYSLFSFPIPHTGGYLH